MNLKDYFEKYNGFGYLSTSKENEVNTAPYAKPFVISERSIQFITASKRTREYLESNPKACYLFQKDNQLDGLRLYLKLENINDNEEDVFKLLKSKNTDPDSKSQSIKSKSPIKKAILNFSVIEIRPYVGDGEPEVK